MIFPRRPIQQIFILFSEITNLEGWHDFVDFVILVTSDIPPSFSPNRIPLNSIVYFDRESKSYIRDQVPISMHKLPLNQELDGFLSTGKWSDYLGARVLVSRDSCSFQQPTPHTTTNLYTHAHMQTRTHVRTRVCMHTCTQKQNTFPFAHLLRDAATVVKTSVG